MQGIGFKQFDIERVREEFRKMSDEELVKAGKMFERLVSPETNYKRPPNPAFVVQLQEARAEWQRRHPKTEKNTK